jgi:glycosyltransferase involved in cell wall biosynthesis
MSEFSAHDRITIAHITTVDMGLRYLLLNQLQAIVREGYLVVGISAPGANTFALEEAGIQHIAVPMTRRITPLRDLVALWQLYRVMRRFHFTIVHTHTPKPALLGQIAARLARVPIVVNTVHGFYFHDNMASMTRRFHIQSERVAARCSDAILSQNAEDIETAVREKIAPRSKLAYLGNGIDLERFNPELVDPARVSELRAIFGIPSQAPVVGYVGRLVEEKGVLELLAAARLVREQIPDAHFLFVGPIDREKSDAVRPERAREFGMADACRFVGERQDMPEMYRLMDVFVLPSHREGYPRAPMEASAMGVPCIVTDIRGCREVVEAGCNGLLVPPRRVDSLASAILRVLDSPAMAARFGEEGRRLARERFDERAVFRTVLSTYERLINARGVDTRKGKRNSYLR